MIKCNKTIKQIIKTVDKRVLLILKYFFNTYITKQIEPKITEVILVLPFNDLSITNFQPASFYSNIVIT